MADAFDLARRTSDDERQGQLKVLSYSPCPTPSLNVGHGSLDPFAEPLANVGYLREAEDAGPSKALRPTRAHKVVGCVSCSLPQCRVGRELHEKGSSAAS